MSYIVTNSGMKVFFDAPEPNSILLEDVAHHLSLLCRFTGATRRFYSVAEHSILCSYLVPAEHALTALMHDATETYLGDVSRPLKHLLPDYVALEHQVWDAISQRFGLPASIPTEVKEADIAMLLREKLELMPTCEDWGFGGILPANIAIPYICEPHTAKAWFLERFHTLDNRRPTHV